eukprot:3028596-Alexandrium_andersonii.AAC.1
MCIRDRVVTQACAHGAQRASVRESTLAKAKARCRSQQLLCHGGWASPKPLHRGPFVHGEGKGEPAVPRAPGTP